MAFTPYAESCSQHHDVMTPANDSQKASAVAGHLRDATADRLDTKVADLERRVRVAVVGAAGEMDRPHVHGACMSRRTRAASSLMQPGRSVRPHSTEISVNKEGR